MRLYLLRHAEAAADAPEDSLRELTELGWAQAQSVADWLCQQVSGRTYLMASPLLRARQTASVVQQMLGLPDAEILDVLTPEGDPLRAEQAISLAVRADVDDLIVVSHMPLIASLQSWLEEGVLTSGSPFSLAEVRVLEAEVLAPGLGRRCAEFLPEEANRALGADLRALITRR